MGVDKFNVVAVLQHHLAAIIFKATWNSTSWVFGFEFRCLLTCEPCTCPMKHQWPIKWPHGNCLLCHDEQDWSSHQKKNRRRIRNWKFCKGVTILFLQLGKGVWLVGDVGRSNLHCRGWFNFNWCSLMATPFPIELLKQGSPLSTPNRASQKLLPDVPRQDHLGVDDLANRKIRPGCRSGNLFGWKLLLVAGHVLVHRTFAILPCLKGFIGIIGKFLLV